VASGKSKRPFPIPEQFLPKPHEKEEGPKLAVTSESLATSPICNMQNGSGRVKKWIAPFYRELSENFSDIFVSKTR
jgi:hypothetical protein